MSLDEFEPYLVEPFNPTKVAAHFVQNVNSADSVELDLETPAKKVHFDMIEADKRMQSTAGSNHEQLIANLTKLDNMKKALKEVVNPHVDHINSSYARIDANMIVPYNEAVKLNNALKRIHTTSDLLRGASHFIYLIQQIQQAEGVKLARLLNQLTGFYNSSDSSLTALKLLSDYKPILANKKLELQKHDTAIILGSQFNEESKDVQESLQSLFLTNETEFYAIFDNATTAKQVQIASTQLSRALQSPRNLTSVVSEIYEHSKEFFPKVQSVLSNAGLLENVLEKQNGSSLLDVFWVRLSLRFKKSIAATMARGGPIAKNLRIYKGGIRNLLADIFPEGSLRDGMMEGVDLIT